MNKNYVNNYQDKRLEKIEKHVETMNHEFGYVQADVTWLKKFFWLLAGATISGLVVGLLNLFFK